jgi:hypothetical protein
MRAQSAYFSNPIVDYSRIFMVLSLLCVIGAAGAFLYGAPIEFYASLSISYTITLRCTSGNSHPHIIQSLTRKWDNGGDRTEVRIAPERGVPISLKGAKL